LMTQASPAVSAHGSIRDEITALETTKTCRVETSHPKEAVLIHWDTILGKVRPVSP